jgi:hypothetical protein
VMAVSMLVMRVLVTLVLVMRVLVCVAAAAGRWVLALHFGPDLRCMHLCVTPMLSAHLENFPS